jgi:prepilin-type N-terminal cleavage/methylation domain-containing protein
MCCQTSNNSLKLNEPHGFTIIEVLMAMTIFLIGFLAVGSMQIAAVNGNTSARMRTSASILAADVVEKLMRCPYDSTDCSIVRYGEDDPLKLGRHPDPDIQLWFADDPDGNGPDGTLLYNGNEAVKITVLNTGFWQPMPSYKA